MPCAGPFVVKNGSKARLRVASSIPIPVSATSTVTYGPGMMSSADASAAANKLAFSTRRSSLKDIVATGDDFNVLNYLDNGQIFALIGAYAPTAFLGHFTVFVLACFVGYMVVWNVTPALHTPLMSVTNAISSIIAIGALVQVAPPLVGGVADRPNALILGLAVFALALTAVNMFGGFAVTRRMLAMFRK